MCEAELFCPRVSPPQASAVRQWVKEVGLPPRAEAQVADFLEELGAMSLEDLAELTDGHVVDLLKLVPPLKLNKFKERLVIHRPVRPPQ